MNGTKAIFISYMHKASHSYKSGEVKPLLLVSVINPITCPDNHNNLPQTLFPLEESCIPSLLTEIKDLKFGDEILCDMRGRYLGSKPQLFALTKAKEQKVN